MSEPTNTPEERQEAALKLVESGDWGVLGLDMEDGLYERIALCVVTGVAPGDRILYEVARRFNDRAEETNYWAEELGQTPPQEAPEWTPEELQALEAADATDTGCTTCPACDCPGMN
jgi:hypothetical protein